VSGQGTVKNKVKVDEHATGHRKVPPEGAPSNWKDKLRIKYCVAATVKIDGVTKLKECDPELIVKRRLTATRQPSP
jgi:hypothetical protein